MFYFRIRKNIRKLKKKILKNNFYTCSLYKKCINRISKKVREEAIELIVFSLSENKKEIINEYSDLLYYLLVLVHHVNLKFSDILKKIKKIIF
ncbi:MAG: phosphoribosyl-ATP diphosphatase [Buchnera aphidicola (Periphyllus lyropictus)]|uniref:phosphoribosyl-ATP diphosphatase n=1 Tax=Buchnera aphidicola TaxID=9 RepID=UPI001EB843D5|nr:phosphoribosyl-ATP diphosphatase [Buchnera aphidicola (Periphyllus lyropictus)]